MYRFPQFPANYEHCDVVCCNVTMTSYNVTVKCCNVTVIAFGWETVQRPSLDVSSSRVAGETASPAASPPFHSSPDCLEEQVFVIEYIVRAQVHKFVKIFRGVD